MIIKILVSAAIAVASVGQAPPTSADPNPFGTLSCSCRDTAPPGSPALGEETDRGVQDGMSAWLPGHRAEPVK